MSTNGIWKSHFEDEEGYGDTVWTYGRINIVDGKTYMDSTRLDLYFKDFDGKIVGFEVVFGLANLDALVCGIDAKIAPLVNALRARGVRTLHSCEGHLEQRGKYSYLCPQVDFPAVDGSKLPALPAGWKIEMAPWNDAGVVRLRPEKDAANDEELRRMQDEAAQYAQTLAL